MASSGTISTNITSWLKLQVYWSTNSQSGNTSNVTCTARLVSTASSGVINSSTNKNISLTINGTKYTSTCTVGISGNSTKNLFSKTVNITHNTDGTKTFAISCTLDIEVTLSGTYYSSKTVSGNATLNAIPAASDFTISVSAGVGSLTMGAGAIFNITRKVSTYKHSLWYKWNGTSYKIADNVGTSYTWATIPTALASDIPNATKGSITLICKTYTSGGAYVGETSGNYTVNVPAGAVPTVSLKLSEAVAGIAAQFGAYVNGKSKIAFSVTAAGSNGSTIKSYSVNIAGQKFSSGSGTTGFISAPAGTNTATVTVTDSRGRSATANTSFTVYAYSAPNIDFKVTRVRSDGTEDDEGSYLRWTVGVEISPCGNKNTATYGLGYKKTTDTSYTALEHDISKNEYSVAKTMWLQSPEFSTDYAYDIRFVVSDFFGTVTKVVKLPTAAPIFDILADGTGIAFGKVASVSNVDDFEKPVAFQNNTSENWVNYAKFNNFNIDPNKIKVPFTFTNKNMPSDYDGYGYVKTFYLEENKEQGVQIALPHVHDGNTDYRKKGVKVRNFWTANNERVFTPWRPLFNADEFEQPVLWEDGLYMQASHTATLKYADGSQAYISEQRNGIVLIFSAYRSGKVEDYDFTSHFVPKSFVAWKAGKGMSFRMGSSGLACIGEKYLYIHDNKIVGHDSNALGGTINGVTYDNTKWVLRRIIGV